MVSTFTPNIQLEEPARGDDVGTWDTPVNSNMTLLDLVVGGATGISAAAGSVVLAAAQFQCNRITINSTLLASITITFPTSFQKTYDIYNTATGSSAFTITLQTTAAGGEKICCPPGELTEVFNNGQSLRFKSLGRVGSYMDYAGSSVPNWVSGCTIPPYLNCDGSAVSSSVYPALFSIIGPTLPDTRGRYRATLDQGATRLTSGVTGFSPDTVAAAGSSQTKTLVTANLPPYTPSGSVTIFSGTNIGQTDGVANCPGGSTFAVIKTIVNITGSFTGTAQGGTSTPLSIIPPTYMGGITMIRAA